MHARRLDSAELRTAGASFNAAGGLIYGCEGYEKYVPYSEAVAATGKHSGGGAATEAEVSYATRVSQLPKYVASPR